MTWGMVRDYPRAIIHIDGDAFFASCEVAKNPWLKGKPVVTGKERGIVSSASYEAKRAGIGRGIPLSQVKKLCPEAVIISSDFELYSLYSKRMNEIVRRYSPEVEEYGIDECFADLTGMRRVNRMSYEEMARAIKADLYRELNITFSLGMAPTKVLAKLGSKWEKPDGFTCIPLTERERFLAETPVDRVWGIGPNTAAYLAKKRVFTALALAQKTEEWVLTEVSKPIRELWHELRGESVMPLITEKTRMPQSVQKTRTFEPSIDPSFIRSELSKNIESACFKVRRHGLLATHASFFLKSQEFQYYTVDLPLPRPTNVPQDILAQVEPRFREAYRPGIRFRTTGITLSGLRPHSDTQPSLFEEGGGNSKLTHAYEQVDRLADRFGKQVIFLGSSFEALRRRALTSDRKELPLIIGSGKRLPLPILGEVS
jgi:DNA polymerase-4/DNA polymerase V